MSVRAYDPSVGRFIARDSLGRAPLFFADQPYAYAGNNPLTNVDPSGQMFRRFDDTPYSVQYAVTHPARISRLYAFHSHGHQGMTCNPKSIDASYHCLVWGKYANGIRAAILDQLVSRGNIEQLGGYLLIVAADVLGLLSKSVLDRLIALADILATIINNIIPLWAKVTAGAGPNGQHAYQEALHWASIGNGFLSGLHWAIAAYQQANWFVKNGIDTFANLAQKGIAPIPSMLIAIVLSVLGSAFSRYLDSVAHNLLRLGLERVMNFRAGGSSAAA